VLEIEESGRFPPAMKFAGLGAKPKAFGRPGEPKSSISSFRMMPSSVTKERDQHEPAYLRIRLDWGSEARLTDSRAPKQIHSRRKAHGHPTRVNHSHVTRARLGTWVVTRRIVIGGSESVLFRDLRPGFGGDLLAQVGELEGCRVRDESRIGKIRSLAVCELGRLDDCRKGKARISSSVRLTPGRRTIVSGDIDGGGCVRR